MFETAKNVQVSAEDTIFILIKFVFFEFHIGFAKTGENMFKI